MLSLQAAGKLALALPEAKEQDHFGSRSFRIRGKIFAQLSAADKQDKRAILKLAVADQTALIRSGPETFSSVPQWGQYGWTYVRLETTGAGIFADLLRQAWRQVAPKKLAAAHRSCANSI